MTIKPKYKQVRRGIAMSLVLIFTMALLTSCGNSPAATDPAKSVQPDKAEAPKTEASKTADSKEPAAAESGEKKTHKLTLLGKAGGNQFIKFSEREEYNSWKEMQKLFDEAGLDLTYELVANEQYQVVIQTRMASGMNLPDVASLDGLETTTALTLGKQGIILELNKLIDQYSNGTIRSSFEKYYPFSDKLSTDPDGNRFWFSHLHYKHYQGNKPAPVGLTVMLRNDWITELGLKVPTTTDEFYNTLKAFRDQDANKNGANDEVYVTGFSGFGNSIAQWFGLGVAVTSVDVTNQKVVSPWYQEGAKEYFTYMKKLVDEGLIDTSALNNIGQVENQRKAENRISGLASYGIEGVNAATTNAKDAQYLPLMPIKAVEGITPYAMMEPNSLLWGMFAITKDCKDLEGAIRLFDVLHSDRAIELLSWGVKDEFYYTDENGTKFYKDRTSDEEYAKQRRARGNSLWGDTVFPIIQEANLEYELASVPKFKADYQLSIMDYKPWYSSSNSAFFAIPNAEQLEAKNRIYNNINTYSQELATSLILGQESLDDWDKLIAKFKELGLDELIKIDQELVDRYNSL